MDNPVYVVWVGMEQKAKYLDGQTALKKANELWAERDGKSLFDSVSIEIIEEEWV